MGDTALRVELDRSVKEGCSAMHVATLKAAVKLILWLLLAEAIHARAQEALWPTHSSAPPPIVQGFAEFGDVSKTKYHTGLDLGVPLGTSVFPARFNPQRLETAP